MKSNTAFDPTPRSALLLSSAASPYPSELDHFRESWSDQIVDLALDLRADRPTALWAMQIDDAVRSGTGPIVIVAYGETCLAFAHWAQLSPASYTANILGALLYLPSLALDVRPAGLPEASPQIGLPFPSILLSDTVGSVDAILLQADVWGSRFIDVAAQDSAYRSDLRSGGSIAEQSLLALVSGVSTAGSAAHPKLSIAGEAAVSRNLNTLK